MASRPNRNAPRGVLYDGPAMEALLGDCADAAVTRDATLEREVVGRLEDASRLAFRVALGVLHNREDAEDIAQEALVRAYRNFGRLRDRERFRAWLVRIAWRLALDHRRSQGRRERLELAVSGHAAPPGVEQMAAWREFERHLYRPQAELPEMVRIGVASARGA